MIFCLVTLIAFPDLWTCFFELLLLCQQLNTADWVSLVVANQPNWTQGTLREEVHRAGCNNQTQSEKRVNLFDAHEFSEQNCIMEAKISTFLFCFKSPIQSLKFLDDSFEIFQMAWKILAIYSRKTYRLNLTGSIATLQGWRKCCSAVATLRAEQGSCEPSKGLVTQSRAS